MSERKKVVVIGGGFGGLSAAQHLNSNLVEVTLVDRRNYHLFQPLVYQVATGSLSAGEVAVPLRSASHARLPVFDDLGRHQSRSDYWNARTPWLGGRWTERRRDQTRAEANYTAGEDEKTRNLATDYSRGNRDSRHSTAKHMLGK
jgi:phytoene dehydrogenase-like protein